MGALLLAVVIRFFRTLAMRIQCIRISRLRILWEAIFILRKIAMKAHSICNSSLILILWEATICPKL